MKKTAFCLLVLTAFIFAGHSQPEAAATKAPVSENQRAGAQIKTKYFELTIPAGWFMPQPVKQRPNDGISAVFAPENGKMAMTINVMPAPVSAQEIAKQTVAQMIKSGLKATEPVEKNGFWVVDVEGKAKGRAWFGADGTLCSIITIFGSDVAAANEILGAVKGADARLIPKSIN